MNFWSTLYDSCQPSSVSHGVWLSLEEPLDFIMSSRYYKMPVWFLLYDDVRKMK